MMTKYVAGFSTLLKPLTALFAALVLTVAGPPEGTAESSYAEAVGLMKREQTLGEAGAGLLKTFAKDDMATLAQGIQLYAFAQADFNGLLETLQGTLIEGGDLADSQPPLSASQTSRSEALAPRNPCIFSVTHPHRHVQTA